MRRSASTCTGPMKPNPATAALTLRLGEPFGRPECDGTTIGFRITAATVRLRSSSGLWRERRQEALALSHLDGGVTCVSVSFDRDPAVESVRVQRGEHGRDIEFALPERNRLVRRHDVVLKVDIAD